MKITMELPGVRGTQVVAQFQADVELSQLRSLGEVEFVLGGPPLWQ